MSPTLQADCLPPEPPGKPRVLIAQATTPSFANRGRSSPEPGVRKLDLRDVLRGVGSAPSVLVGSPLLEVQAVPPGAQHQVRVSAVEVQVGLCTADLQGGSAGKAPAWDTSTLARPSWPFKGLCLAGWWR